MLKPSQQLPPWWGTINFEQSHSKLWRIGPLTMIVRCLSDEWLISYERQKIFEDSDISVTDTDVLPEMLEEPKPVNIFQGFGDSSLNIQFSVWAIRENFLNLKNSIHEEIKNAFDVNGMEIPFPLRTLYTGSVTEPFPISQVKKDPANKWKS